MKLIATFLFLGFEFKTGVQAVLMKQGVDPAYDMKSNETKTLLDFIEVENGSGCCTGKTRNII